MEKILLVARNVFRGIMGKRAVYIWGAAVLLMFLRAAPAILMRGNEQMLAYVRANAVSGALEVWSALCIGAAILLGAGAVATEITSKTIVTLLARPIRRWEVLAGKWLGVTSFALVSLALGLALDMAIARYLGIDVDRTVLAIALAQSAVSIVLFGGVAVALSGAGSAPLAAAVTVLLLFMPSLVDVLKGDTARTRRAIGTALGYATPPGFDSLYAGVAWAPFPRPTSARGPMIARQPPVVDYKAQRTNLLKNTGYAGLYFLVGCFFFSRGDVKLS